MYVTFLFLFNIIVGYLIGSICSAVIVCRLFDLPDPRLKGSKNPGATNVLRLAGKQYAAIVLLADMFKGLLPLLLAESLGAGPVTLGFTCLAAVFGHMYPIFFGFKGGKGVATSIGALLGLNFILGVMVIVTWSLVANFSRYSSVASIVSMILAPFYSLYALGNISAFLPLSIITLFILYKHRENITRLEDGNESKIDFHHKALNEVMIPDGKVKSKKPSKLSASHKTGKTVVKTLEKPKKKESISKIAKSLIKKDRISKTEDQPKKKESVSEKPVKKAALPKGKTKAPKAAKSSPAKAVKAAKTLKTAKATKAPKVAKAPKVTKDKKETAKK
jgi:glycerol-3-phosphate acyltransferase PlsY